MFNHFLPGTDKKFHLFTFQRHAKEMSANFVLTSVSIREGGALQFWGNFENLTLQALQFSLENENAQSVTHIKPVTIYLASSQKGDDLN